MCCPYLILIELDFISYSPNKITACCLCLQHTSFTVVEYFHQVNHMALTPCCCEQTLFPIKSDPSERASNLKMYPSCIVVGYGLTLDLTVIRTHSTPIGIHVSKLVVHTPAACDRLVFLVFWGPHCLLIYDNPWDSTNPWPDDYESSDSNLLLVLTAAIYIQAELHLKGRFHTCWAQLISQRELALLPRQK